MKLCEEQRVTIFIVIQLIVFCFAYALGVIDWKALVTLWIGDGSMSILVYWLYHTIEKN